MNPIFLDRLLELADYPKALARSGVDTLALVESERSDLAIDDHRNPRK